MKRWHGHAARTVRLDQLHPAVAAAVRALIAADAAAKTGEAEPLTAEVA